MGLLNSIEIKNFECFREETSFNFSDATFFIGENNSGKSSIFRAICLFFDKLEFNINHLNKTAYKSKRRDSKICEIAIKFDLSFLRINAFKQRLIKYNNKQNLLSITARFIYKTPSYEKEFIVAGEKFTYEKLNEDIQKLITDSVRINYIHPQQGAELLAKAQEKLQKRLLDNWGRSSTFSRELNQLDIGWGKYKNHANTYLSDLLTDKVKSFWGKGKVKINLPESIRDVIKIGNVSFQADEDLPEIQLTSHGTGVQQSLLYYASYVLDSDRTLRRNKEYQSIWLLEEPESFLHADMIIKLAKDITSKEWLENIQLLITTHSGLLLSNSMNTEENILWNILEKHKRKDAFEPTKIDEKKILDIGTLMGDPYFDVYFYASTSKIFIEDSSDILISRLNKENINAKGLGGISEVERYLKALDITCSSKLGRVIKAKFIIDGDGGKGSVKEYIKDEHLIKEVTKFKKYVTSNGIIIVVLPDGETSENLFDEFPIYLNELAQLICNDDRTLKKTCP